MIDKLTHFAIYADNLDRAASFYKKVFQWNFKGYGGPDFQQIETNHPGKENELIGALQHRKFSMTPEKVIGFECSIAVENVENTATAVEQAGGTILMPKTEIPQVGWIIKFQDTEGNIACAVQYGT